MAPEQLEAGKVSVRSDIYSLGLLLYELFTGKRAFEGSTLEELKSSRKSGSIPSMQSEDEAVDPAVERVILRCLEPDRQIGRPRSTRCSRPYRAAIRWRPPWRPAKRRRRSWWPTPATPAG